MGVFLKKAMILIAFRDWLNKNPSPLCHSSKSLKFYVSTLNDYIPTLSSENWSNSLIQRGLRRMVMIALNNTEVTFQMCTVLWNYRHMHILLLQLCLQFAIQCQQKILSVFRTICKYIFFILPLYIVCYQAR